MKILMLGWELPPHNSGGLGVACYQLCKALSKKDVDLEFILPYEAEHNVDFMKITAAHPQGVKEVIKSGIAYDSYKYTYVDGHEEWHDIYSQQLMFEHAAARLASSREFDVLHAHDWLTFRAALRIKVQTGCPIILHVHSIESDRAGGGSGNPLVREIESTAFQMADRIVAVSNFTKQAIIREYDIPADKIEVVHNSIEITELTNEPDNAYRYLEALKSQGYRVVCNIGRLTIQKGLPNFLRAAKDVVALRPKTMFLIVGNGEQYLELLEQAANLGIAKNVIFTGFQRGKNWRDAFRIADLFVMPSVSEPFGLTPLEAIPYGTPSIVSKQSGVSEVLYNCLKVDFWDIDEMANQILAVVNNDALRDELHRNALKEYTRLSWNDAADKLIGMYHHHTREAVLAA
ncbi:MAG: glycosyltransferase family 4 protein [Candidatus Saccharimonadales bacterium]